MTDPLVDEYAIASTFVGKIWAAALPALRSADPHQRPMHFSGALDRDLLEQARLPIGTDRTNSQTVALVDAERFERHSADSSIDGGYQHRPRTKVYEGVETRSNGWYSVAALQLARLARCRVVCTMYESRSGDLNIGAHVDEWFGAIVQMRGSKEWSIPPQSGQPAMGFTSEPGDFLLMPPHVQHEVSTPERSTHVVFAFLTTAKLTYRRPPCLKFLIDESLRQS